MRAVQPVVFTSALGLVTRLPFVKAVLADRTETPVAFWIWKAVEELADVAIVTPVFATFRLVAPACSFVVEPLFVEPTVTVSAAVALVAIFMVSVPLFVTPPISIVLTVASSPMFIPPVPLLIITAVAPVVFPMVIVFAFAFVPILIAPVVVLSRFNAFVVMELIVKAAPDVPCMRGVTRLVSAVPVPEIWKLLVACSDD